MRILHVSDLHERGPREREHWRRRRVLGEAWERNVDEILGDGAVDLVCFTGDVADWGTPGEYGAATAFFERLLSRLRLGAERLFVIPGNHDITRPVEEDAWKALRDALARGLDPLALSRWMADLDKAPPLGVEPSLRSSTLRARRTAGWVTGARWSLATRRRRCRSSASTPRGSPGTTRTPVGCA
ncbi:MULTISPECIES: metallophosphoesterase family protein [Sorangium]|uniref:metallophosphoesterase family protein n=1 Tax=Sorangium TaxID=39643 RepID=UPI003D9C1C06